MVTHTTAYIYIKLRHLFIQLFNIYIYIYIYIYIACSHI